MINDLPFTAMQAAVDAVPDSPHPHNKIAATLFDDDIMITKTNHWPDIIDQKIGRTTKIGNSSGTIHAETACILSAKKTKNASIAITDPFCPNCAKNIAEAGIKKIYIDHKGFDKDFFKRRSGHFDTMSMHICEKAGINVYELWRKEQKLVPILEISKSYIPSDDSPVRKTPIARADDFTFQTHLAEAHERHQRRKFSLCFAQDHNNKAYCLTARAHAAIGFSMQRPEDAYTLEHPHGKYSFIQEPINRLLMVLAREGLSLCDPYLYCSQVPTSREQVNLAGAGISRIAIGDTKKCRDAHGITAMQQLKQAGTIDYS